MTCTERYKLPNRIEIPIKQFITSLESLEGIHVQKILRNDGYDPNMISLSLLQPRSIVYIKSRKKKALNAHSKRNADELEVKGILDALVSIQGP